MEIISLFIADDHLIFRKGLVTVLNENPNVKVLDEASNGIELLRKLKKQVPDIILMDIKMPEMDGIKATTKVRELYPQVGIIALTMHEEISYFNEMMKAGANGFIFKRTDPDELKNAIQTVFNGDYYIAEEFRNNPAFQLPDKKSKIELSKREREILEAISKGLSTSEIAQKYGLSTKTIEGHRSRLFDKFGAKNAASLIMLAVKQNVIN